MTIHHKYIDNMSKLMSRLSVTRGAHLFDIDMKASFLKSLIDHEGPLSRKDVRDAMNILETWEDFADAGSAVKINRTLGFKEDCQEHLLSKGLYEEV